MLTTAITMLAASLSIAAAEKPGVSLTVYSSADPGGFDPQRFIAQQRMGHDPNAAWQVPGFGVVKEVRTIDLEEELGSVRFTDVAAFIDPTTVSFTDLSDATTTVLEQNFEFDLVSPSKLLEKFLDKDIVVEVDRNGVIEQIRGRLLSSAQGTIVLQTGDGVRILPQGQSIVTVSDSSGLITRPTLVWKVKTDTTGERLVRTTYQTSGITWRADYSLVLNADDTVGDLGAWVSLLNVSGAAYRDATLKLIAGDVQRVQPRQPMFSRRAGAEMLGMAADAGFEEKSFFEYHLYTLPRQTSIAANTTQQIALFPTATGVPVSKTLVFDPGASWSGVNFGREPYLDQGFGLGGEGRVDVEIRFLNDEASKLGMPLPAGKVRVYKEDDADGTLEFIGENLIDHTPRNEKVEIVIGRAFDVVGERKQTNFSIDRARRQMTETFEIELRNRKAVPQTVLVRERLYRWMNWEITADNANHRKVDARTIEWDLALQPDEVKTLNYTVRYSW